MTVTNNKSPTAVDSRWQSLTVVDSRWQSLTVVDSHMWKTLACGKRQQQPMMDPADVFNAPPNPHPHPDSGNYVFDSRRFIGPVEVIYSCWLAAPVHSPWTTPPPSCNQRGEWEVATSGQLGAVTHAGVYSGSIPLSPCKNLNKHRNCEILYRTLTVAIQQWLHNNSTTPQRFHDSITTPRLQNNSTTAQWVNA